MFVDVEFGERLHAKLIACRIFYWLFFRSGFVLWIVYLGPRSLVESHDSVSGALIHKPLHTIDLTFSQGALTSNDAISEVRGWLLLRSKVCYLFTGSLDVVANLQVCRVNLECHCRHRHISNIQLLFEHLGDALLLNVLAEQLTNAFSGLLTFSILVV
jgi:hypothetical protein